MKSQLLVTVFILAIGLFASPAFSEELSAFAGKWTCQKTNEDGQRYSQTIEIKKDKFTFKVLSPDGETRLYAEGDVKLDKSAPFQIVIFSNVKAGGSSSDTTPIEDTYTSIYKFVDSDSLLVVMNFDKERDEQQRPRLDDYRKVK
jgi:uncharacterized protein (TIGR03067 family)